MTETETNKMTLFLPITAQPPTFGLVMSIKSIEDNYDKIIICILDKPIVIETHSLLKMLSSVFKPPKYILISHPCDFEIFVEFPNDIPQFDFVATVSDRTYSNMLIKGYACVLLPRPLGFDEVFCRTAFRQSQHYEILRQRIKIIPNIDDKNTESSSVGGDIENDE